MRAQKRRVSATREPARPPAARAHLLWMSCSHTPERATALTIAWDSKRSPWRRKSGGADSRRRRPAQGQDLRAELGLDPPSPGPSLPEQRAGRPTHTGKGRAPRRRPQAPEGPLRPHILKEFPVFGTNPLTIYQLTPSLSLFSACKYSAFSSSGLLNTNSDQKDAKIHLQR